MHLPSFPPKKWFGNMKSKFISLRKKLLEDYFNFFLTNSMLVKDPLTLQYFEMTENEKFFLKNTTMLTKNELPLRISISRKYNVKMFFDEFDTHNGMLSHKNSFTLIGFCPNKALEDLKTFRNGTLHVQAFLNAYNLVFIIINTIKKMRIF